METKKLIYEMLTECTGKHICDRGFSDGRHWQRNQKKTIEDFENEPEEHIYKDGDYIYRNLSVFHYLSELELDDICNEFNKINTDCKDWDAEVNDDIFIYGVSKEAWQRLPQLGQGMSLNSINIHNTFNTYNYDNDLTQVLQGSNLTINDEEYILLQIHNGADVRGGYTDAKLFKLNDEGLIHPYLLERMDEYELEQILEEDLICN